MPPSASPGRPQRFSATTSTLLHRLEPLDWRAILAVGVVCAWLLGCGGAEVATPAGSPLEQALAMRDEGRLPQAEAALQRLVDQGVPAALPALAETLMLRGQHAKAADLLLPRLEAAPDDAEVAALLARALDGAGRPDEAVAAYARRLTLVPDDAVAASRMAELLMARRDHAGASAVVAAALKSHPDDPGLLVQHARALLGRGRVPQALEAAHRATQLAPQNPDAHLALAQVLALAGEVDLAEVAYGKCLAIDPQHPLALRELGTLLVEKGDTQRATTVLKRALQVSPDSVPTWNALAAARHRERDFDGALAALDEAVRIQPGVAQIHRNIAEVALDHGVPKRALAEALVARTLAAQRQIQADVEAAEDLLVRAAVVEALAAAVCRKSRDAKAVEGEIQRELQGRGIQVEAERIASVGAAATEQVKAAAARCGAQSKTP